MTILANAFISEHDIVQGRKYLEEARCSPIAPGSQVLTLMTNVWRGYWQRDWEQAARDVDEAINIGLAEPDMAVWHILGLQFRAALVVLPGGLVRIERYRRNGVPCQLAAQNALLKASLTSLQAFTYLMRGQLNEAIQANEYVLQSIGELEDAIWVIADSLIISLHLCLARDDCLRWERFIALVQRFKSHPLFETYQFLICYLEGRACWQQERREEVQQICQAFPLSEEFADARFLHDLLQALLEIANQQYRRAEITLKAAKELVSECVLGSYIADVAPIFAYLYLRWGKPQRALTELEPLLVKCEGENIPGWLLWEGTILFPLLELAVKKGCHADYAAKLLQAVGREEILRKKVAGPDSLLSSREGEVLHLLADGLSNREIAHNLIISELTVKSHIKHLFQKLDVSSRASAVFRAHQLGLLP